MVAPFNYNIGLAQPPSPMQAFAQTYQMVDTLQQNQQKRQQEATQRERDQQFLVEVGGIEPNARPEAFLELVKRFPEKSELLTGQYKALDEARQNGLFSAGQRAFTLLEPGPDGAVNADAAIADLEKSAMAFENSGAADVAKQLRMSIDALKINPQRGRGVMGTLLAFTDGKRFKEYSEGMGGKDDTAFQRDYGFIRGQFGQEAADKFANAKIDETAMIPLPGGRVYVGPRSGIAAAMGGAPAPATGGPRLGTIEDGFRFKGGDPAKPENWEKVR